MAGAHGLVEPQTFVFDDDGLVPNNRLPVLRYRLAVDVTGNEPERIFENLFTANGWGDLWRNGIFDYLHYHATVQKHSASRAVMPRSGWAAIMAPRSNSLPATS
jgi:uncharacterized protein YjlB